MYLLVKIYPGREDCPEIYGRQFFSSLAAAEAELAAAREEVIARRVRLETLEQMRGLGMRIPESEYLWLLYSGEDFKILEVASLKP